MEARVSIGHPSDPERAEDTRLSARSNLLDAVHEDSGVLSEPHGTPTPRESASELPNIESASELPQNIVERVEEGSVVASTIDPESPSILEDSRPSELNITYVPEETQMEYDSGINTSRFESVLSAAVPPVASRDLSDDSTALNLSDLEGLR